MPALKQILVIEDDPDDQAIMKQAAESIGLKAELVFKEDGETGLAHLNDLTSSGRYEKLPDLIMLDLNLPGMHGLEVLKSIRGNESLRCLPVIIMTTSSSNSDVQNCYEAGANSFITKPRKFAEFTESLMTLEQYWAFAQIPRPSS